MEPIHAVGILACVTLGLAGWALNECVKLGKEMAAVKARIEDGDRRFDELKEGLDRLHHDIFRLQNILQEICQHMPRRAGDSAEWKTS